MLQQDMANSEGLASYYEQETMKLEHSAEVRQAVPASHESIRNQAVPALSRSAPGSIGMTGSPTVSARIPAASHAHDRDGVGDLGAGAMASTSPTHT